MAPQNKRTTKMGQSPSKKARVSTAQPEDALAAQLAPILAALASNEQSASSCEMLRAALPHCLADASEVRHAYQTRILDLTAAALKGVEESERTGLAAAEARAMKAATDATVAKADYEVAQGLVDKKKEECDAKGVEVEKLGKDVEAAKLEVQGEVQKKEAFLESKVTLVADQEAFQTVIAEMWEPLKAASHSGQQWRKRDKTITDMVQKFKPLALEESLVEALVATMKLKVEQRSAFAQKAIDMTEVAIEKHKTETAQRIAGLGEEEAARDQAVADAEARLVEVQRHCSEQEQEYVELQNAWAPLTDKVYDAKKAAETLEADVQIAQEEIAECKASVDASLLLAATFVDLRDPPAVAEEVAGDAEVSAAVDAEVVEPSIAMEAVAAA